MTDIGTALEKLIDVLQLEGHELFEVFVKAQGVIGVAHILIAILVVFGGVFGSYYIWKLAKKYDWCYDDGEKTLLVLVSGIVIGVILFVLSYCLFSGYMHIYYPEYTAARELISQIGYLT